MKVRSIQTPQKGQNWKNFSWYKHGGKINCLVNYAKKPMWKRSCV